MTRHEELLMWDVMNSFPQRVLPHTMQPQDNVQISVPVPSFKSKQAMD